MFEDSSEQGQIVKPSASRDSSFWLEKKYQIASVVLALFLIIFGIVVMLVFKKNQNADPSPDQNNESANNQAATSSTSTSTLPSNPLNPDNLQNQENDLGDVKAESLAFSQFYQASAEKLDLNISQLKLPIDIKAQVANYYDFSRKIDLSDDQVNELNKNGFIMSENTVSANDDNFYGAYIALDAKAIPELITTDFLLYNYQNSIKQVFDDIKSSTFYQDLWIIDKSFYDIANNRYKNTLAKVGLVNSPVLEGQRLEAAYFATALELLKPKVEQVHAPGLSGDDKFTDQDLLDYDFTLPDYLSDDVKKEEELIYSASQTKKSPVFRYDRDYAAFKVPDNLNNNGKLNNFYLANIWANTEFPLYFKDASCPNCLLDNNDWLINFIASSYIAKDFSDNQDLKNRWARIYKVLSYFSGLRQDLTYLQFQDALAGAYGENYQLENIFSADHGIDKAMTSAINLQSAIEKKYKFSSIEGSYDRQDKSTRPIIGMRLLQEAYWPDDYILKQLITPKVGDYKKAAVDLKNNKLNITACKLDNIKQPQRCSAIGLDIVNLYSPVVRNSYFNENSSYENYTDQSQRLSDQLNNFTTDSWHNSNYWSIMNLSQKTLLGQKGLPGPINSEVNAWQAKNINTVLGAWVNLKLPEDVLKINVKENGNLLSSAEANTFVEPNLELINELLSNTKMLSQMLSALKIVKDVDSASKKLAEFSDDLNKIKLIAEKELQGQSLDNESQQAVLNIVKKYSVINKQDKSVTLKFNSGRTNIQINGVKLLVTVYQMKDRKLLVAGPVFNYSEQ